MNPEDLINMLSGGGQKLSLSKDALIALLSERVIERKKSVTFEVGDFVTPRGTLPVPMLTPLVVIRTLPEIYAHESGDVFRVAYPVATCDLILGGILDNATPPVYREFYYWSGALDEYSLSQEERLMVMLGEANAKSAIATKKPANVITIPRKESAKDKTSVWGGSDRDR